MAAGGIGLAAGSYDRLIPYLQQPEDIIPGRATWYATACRECPAGCAMVVRNRDSRVVKCEGNPGSPVNQGKLCARGQAALHGLYDPDRVKGPMRRLDSGKLTDVSWADALSEIGEQFGKRPRIAFISDLQTGALDALMRAWLTSLGSDRLIKYEPIDHAAVRWLYGGVVPTFDIASSDYLVSFGADFLETWISPVEYARQFAEMRRLRNGKRARFVYVGPRVSMTAANADRRVVVPPGGEEDAARGILAEIKSSAAKAPLALPGIGMSSARAAAEINASGGSKLVNVNRPHALSRASGAREMADLIADMAGGKIDVLIVYGANPAYSLPESAGFAEAVRNVPLVVSLSSFLDETAALAHWLLPSNTPLESWGDYSPYPDVTNILQPTMGLLFDTMHTGDILLGLAGAAGVDPLSAFKAASFYEYLRAKWGLPLGPGETAETVAPEWESLVQKGGRFEAGAAGGGAAYQTGALAVPEAAAAKDGEMRLWAYPHIYYYDGRGANRRWLQETPEPMTAGVWGTWAELNPETAARLGVATDDVVEIAAGKASIQAPAYVWAGVARDTVAVPVGEGHTEYGRFASGTGANVLKLANAGGAVVTVRKTGRTRWAARIKGSTDQHGREIVQTASLAEPFRRERDVIMPLPSGHKRNDFYPGHKYKKHRWAMAIDLEKCIGCHACVTACYAENNLAVVGREQVWRRREMPWIRIDRYMDWREAAAPVLFQPMLCQHCDAAPCEPVCPVYASSHGEEGLNMQIYNRCVGTRYCSHNCPYKVRRFNWFDFEWPPPLQYQLNPDVSVRCRGVMEKCTFCIQRIREAEINALAESRDVADGEIVPACVQTCPTGVFTFGDLKNEQSRVSQLFREEPRAYQVLAELNTKPAIVYLKRIVDRV